MLATDSETFAALAAEFRDWHIWRSRDSRGRDDAWNATRLKRRQPGGSHGLRRLTAPTADTLRGLLAQQTAGVSAAEPNGGVSRQARGSYDMSEAAPQGDKSPADLAAISQALEGLRQMWGSNYLAGHDEKGYWAARHRPPAAGLHRAGTPEELGFKLAEAEAGQP